LIVVAHLFFFRSIAFVAVPTDRRTTTVVCRRRESRCFLGSGDLVSVECLLLRYTFVDLSSLSFFLLAVVAFLLPGTQVPLQPGSTVALVTPFDATTGQVDDTALRRLLQYHVASGTDNVCILGTTGEASSLDMTERARIITLAVEEVKGKLPILVGTGSNNPTSTKAMTQQALDLGGDAALIVTPYYVKPPQRMLIQHMLDMANVGLPVVMYNVPGRTGVDMLDDSLAIAAASHENIVGVKDATGNVARVNSLLSKLAKDPKKRSSFGLYSGDDATSVDFILAGGTGCISVTANVAAATMHLSMKAALAGDANMAREIDIPLQSLHRDLFCESNPIPVKYAVSKIFSPGTVSDYCRPPLDRLLSQYQPVVDVALQRAGVLVL
jgi:4-hydroxy-tetrahydrodipicolinate synthase